MRLLLLVAALVTIPNLVYAETPVSKLTESNIKHFLEESTRITNQKKLSDDKIRSFFNRHLGQGSAYTSVITYEIPGYPPQPRTLTLDKNQFIENIVTGQSMMTDYSSSTELQHHTIDKTGQTATIETMGYERGKMPFQGSQLVPFKGRNHCTQNLKISDEQAIQIVSASCETTIEILE